MTVVKRQLLLGAYVAALFAPLAFMLAGRNPAGSDLVTLTAVGVGAVAFSAMTLQFVIASRAEVIARPFGADLLIRFHRMMGLGVVALALLHGALIVVDRRSRLGDLLEDWGTIIGILALAVLVLLTSRAWPRARPAHNYERWRLTHALLGATALVATFIHVLRSGHFATNAVIAWTVALSVGAAAIGLFWLRVLRPFRLARRPYRLVRVIPERGDAVTLELEPERGGLGDWHAGQFGWLKLADRPYALAEHPFSMSSSACDRARIAFTCKAVGDFTRDLKSLPPGARLLIDGPHGSYRPPTSGVARLLVVAGSGIGPALSILRTMADLGDRSPVRLVYGVRTIAEATLVEQIEELRQRSCLDVTYVASREGPGWQGLHGRIDRSLIQRLVPPDVTRHYCFVCGPGDFVTEIVGALAALGVPDWQLHGERF